MKEVRKFVLLILLIACVLVVQDATAGVTEMLPKSEHHEGRAEFGAGGYVDFAVYDTKEQDVQEFGIANAPGTGQYIYAYQIFSEETSTEAIPYFNLFGLPDSDGNTVGTPFADVENGDMGALEDSSDSSELGVDPEGAFYMSTFDGTDEKFAVWRFDNGLLLGGENSFILVLRSDKDWVAGGYSFNNYEKNVVIPETILNPEPCTIMLLGLGGMLLVRRRRSIG